MTDKDTVDIRYMKTFLVGPPGVGKTTTLNRLLQIIDNICSVGDKDITRSTLLANCVQVFAFVSSDGTEWIASSDLNQEAKLLFRYLCGCKLEEYVAHEQHSRPSQIEVQLITVVRKSPDLQQQQVKTQQHVESRVAAPVIDSRQKASANKVTIEQNRVHAFIGRLQKLIKSDDHIYLMNLIGSTLLTINDIGGQPSFLEMLPALSTGPAMYLVFFNLSKELDKPYKIPFSRDDTIITPYDSVHTVEATISQILSAITSVHCLSSETSFINMSKAVKFDKKFRSFQEVEPVATLLGTHKDKLVDPVEEKLASVNKALIRVTKNYSQILVNPSVNSTFFAVDNFTGTEQSDVGPIREFMSNIFHTRFKKASLPIRSKWLWLSLVLRREYRIVSRANCLDFAKSLEMDEEEVDFALWYLHFCTGTLMYYPDLPDEWFKNHIICSPQVIFDSISQLILASLRTLHSEGFVTEEERAELIKMGQFSIQSIEMYCTSAQVTEKLEKNELIPAKQLIELLRYVNLLSPITHTTSGGSQRITYLMPAILECTSPDELTTPPLPDANNPEPCFISFSCGYVPTGSFCGLITRLVSLGPDRILGLTWVLVEKGVKRNCVSFYVAKSNKVTLIAHERCYEIQISSKHKKIQLYDLSSYVLSAILYILKSLYKQLVPQIAFQCPCPDHKSSRGVDHLCILTDDGFWVQFLCGDNPVGLREHQQIWFGIVSYKPCRNLFYYHLPTAYDSW